MNKTFIIFVYFPHSINLKRKNNTLIVKKNDFNTFINVKAKISVELVSFTAIEQLFMQTWFDLCDQR